MNQTVIMLKCVYKVQSKTSSANLGLAIAKHPLYPHMHVSVCNYVICI